MLSRLDFQRNNLLSIYNVYLHTVGRCVPLLCGCEAANEPRDALDKFHGRGIPRPKLRKVSSRVQWSWAAAAAAVERITSNRETSLSRHRVTNPIATWWTAAGQLRCMGLVFESLRRITSIPVSDPSNPWGMEMVTVELLIYFIASKTYVSIHQNLISTLRIICNMLEQQIFLKTLCRLRVETKSNHVHIYNVELDSPADRLPVVHARSITLMLTYNMSRKYHLWVLIILYRKQWCK